VPSTEDVKVCVDSCVGAAAGYAHNAQDAVYYSTPVVAANDFVYGRTSIFARVRDLIRIPNIRLMLTRAFKPYIDAVNNVRWFVFGKQAGWYTYYDQALHNFATVRENCEAAKEETLTVLRKVRGTLAVVCIFGGITAAILYHIFRPEIRRLLGLTPQLHILSQTHLRTCYQVKSRFTDNYIEFVSTAPDGVIGKNHVAHQQRDPSIKRQPVFVVAHSFFGLRLIGHFFPLWKFTGKEVKVCVKLLQESLAPSAVVQPDETVNGCINGLIRRNCDVRNPANGSMLDSIALNTAAVSQFVNLSQRQQLTQNLTFVPMQL
jgi:hypothetical protein